MRCDLRRASIIWLHIIPGTWNEWIASLPTRLERHWLWHVWNICIMSHSYVAGTSFYTQQLEWADRVTINTPSTSRPKHSFPVYFLKCQLATGWRSVITFNILIDHFLQKSPMISGSFAENDLQLKASYGSSRRGVGGKPQIVAKPDPSVSNSAWKAFFRWTWTSIFATWKLGFLNIFEYLTRNCIQMDPSVS